MNGDNQGDIEVGEPGDDSGEAARMAFKLEISDAISGIIDRDHFLQRLTRRVADVTGVERVAIYTRSTTSGDLMLRSSTVPQTERAPLRVPADAGVALSDVTTAVIPESSGPQQMLSVPITSATDAMGALVLISPTGKTIDETQRQTLTGIAKEIAPAIVVAEHHHAVKQSSVIDLTTGAYELWYLNQRFEEEIARAHRTRNPVTVVLVNILDFDLVQQQLGYARADQLLRDLATEYGGLTRVFDIVGIRARANFTVLLPDTDIADATTVIARVHQRSAKVIEKLHAEMGSATVQVVTGAASFPADGDRVPEVLLAAEQRLDQNEVQHRRMAEDA